MTKATRPSLAILCAVLVASCSPAFSPSPAMPQRASSSAHPQVTNFKSIFSFDGPDGGFPSASLLVFGNKLFGTNEGVGAGPPTVYDVTSSGREYVLYKFYSGSGGGRSLSPLVRVNGVFYGTTTNGGDYGDGSVFAVTESGQVRELTSFYGDGIEPMGGLFPYKGALYGTTSSGGNYNAGTVFRTTTSGNLKTIHEFGTGTDGARPYTTLAVADGDLYGTTEEGGANDLGTVFQINGKGKERVLHSFGSSRGDGAEPVGALVAVNGDLYGTTFAGGASTKCKGSGCGIVFSISTTGKENLLYTFRGGGGDGAGPFGGLLFLNGEFYGTTSEGGPSGVGTVFDLSLSGTERVLHSFGGSDGEAPRAGLVALNGALYGTTLDGGAYSVGTVFKIYP